MIEVTSVAANEAVATTDALLDNAEAFIPGDRREALARGIEMPDRVHGGALFADISGFTPLTEALANELGPQRGAEELTRHLNRVYHALISELERFGGHVIYFSGDAITCWIDGDDGALATACALAMQATLAKVGEIVIPSGSRIRVAMKAAVAVGAARRFLVGDPEIQRIDVLAGRLVDELASTERRAERGEVVLAPSALESLGTRVQLRELRVDEGTSRKFGVVGELSVAMVGAPTAEPDVALSEHIVREWVLPAVYDRLRTGRGEFLAELRPAFPLFLRFGGIDYDDDDDAIAKLDGFVRHVQRILASYDGYLLHLTVGDKGSVPLRRLRRAARPRGRRRARGCRGPRAACARSHQRRRGAPDRHHLRSAAQRHLRHSAGRRSRVSATR